MRVTAFTPKIKLWSLREQVYIWHYRHRTKTMSGWHLKATKEACSSLLELIDIMLESPLYAKKQIPVSLPTLEVMKGFTANGEWSAPTVWTLHLLHEMPRDYWNLQVEKETLLLSCGVTKLLELRNALEEMLHGADDFSVSPTLRQKGEEPMLLWFWGVVKR